MYKKLLDNYSYGSERLKLIGILVLSTNMTNRASESNI